MSKSPLLNCHRYPKVGLSLINGISRCPHFSPDLGWSPNRFSHSLGTLHHMLPTWVVGMNKGRLAASLIQEKRAMLGLAKCFLEQEGEITHHFFFQMPPPNLHLCVTHSSQAMDTAKVSTNKWTQKEMCCTAALTHTWDVMLHACCINMDEPGGIMLGKVRGHR